MADQYSPSIAPAQPTRTGSGIYGMIEGFSVTAEGVVTQVADAATATAPKGGFLWLHLNVGEAGDLIENQLRLDPMVSRQLLAAETRPRCQHLKNGTLINLRGVNLNEGRRPEDMLSVRCWMEADRLITVRMQKSMAIEEIREAYRAGEAHERPGMLLDDMISRLLTLIDPITDGLADGLDALEQEAATKGDTDSLKDRVSAMRHDATIYRRYLAPMRDAIIKLGSRPAPGLAADDIAEIEEDADRATRIVEELDMTIERSGVIVDQMDAARNDRLNRNMMILSVISAIFLPLGFLTGLLGINVGGLPGTDDPRAFGFVVVLCIAIGIMAGAFFKAKDWI